MAFFVFSEKLNVYDDSNADYIETAGIAFIGSLGTISLSLPLYKYFSTKAYRNFISSVDRLQNVGRRIIRGKYMKLKTVLETGTVDERRANGQLIRTLLAS